MRVNNLIFKLIFSDFDANFKFKQYFWRWFELMKKLILSLRFKNKERKWQQWRNWKSKKNIKKLEDKNLSFRVFELNEENLNQYLKPHKKDHFFIIVIEKGTLELHIEEKFIIWKLEKFLLSFRSRFILFQIVVKIWKIKLFCLKKYYSARIFWKTNWVPIMSTFPRSWIVRFYLRVILNKVLIPFKSFKGFIKNRVLLKKNKRDFWLKFFF